MNDLIINGIDHAKFDLEWAKRGGCCIYDDSTDIYKQLILGKQVEERFIGARFFFRDHWVKFFSYFENYPTRMATPAECEAAGIEYIEYHGWHPIESAPKHQAVLVWIKGATPCAAAQDDDGWYEPDLEEELGFNFKPSHWMPLQQVPKDE